MAETTYTAVTWTAGDTITEAKLDSMVANDRAVDAMAQGVELAERSIPSTPPANTIHVHARDIGGNTDIYAVDGAGVDHPLMLPAGLIMPYGGAGTPNGYLLCHGQAVSRTTYARLFSVISTTFGVGDGSTTFNVPDMRGRVPLGQDDMGGSSADRVTDAQADSIAGAGGAEKKDVSHTHTGTVDATAHFSNSGGGTTQEDSKGHQHDFTTGSGGSATQDVMSPYLTTNYLVKT